MSVLADMIRASRRVSDSEFWEEFSTDEECREHMQGLEDRFLKRELADLEIEYRKLCLEMDIMTVKRELEWRDKKQQFEAEQKANRDARKAAEQAKAATSLNGQSLQ